MAEVYSWPQLLFFFFLYSFLGWAVGTACLAISEKQFVNRGILNLPLAPSEGATAVILIVTLPTLEGHTILQYGMTLTIVFILDELAQHFLNRVSRLSLSTHTLHLNRSQKLILRSAEALVYLGLYLLIHPFVGALAAWMPGWAMKLIVSVMLLVTVVDLTHVLRALHGGAPSQRTAHSRAATGRITDRISEKIWSRLEKAYPGIENTEPEERDRYTFAKGLCFDKLVWVFLISSFLGALIEMLYCRTIDGSWMNRSSVLYGSFSVVWGFGAVLLTIVLQRFAEKPDRHVFAAGFVIGGTYEYLCSVLTELVFGTVFWDYSSMPLNIGGRTNVMYCIFWGILAVVWIRVLYPPMDRAVEKLPPVAGKVVTWVVVFFMILNGVLTAAAMIRYSERQTDLLPQGVIQQYLDERYNDAWMENRWPNMKITKP